VVRALDLQLNGHEFNPQLPHLQSLGTGMGDRLQVGIPPQYVTSQSSQLSLSRGMRNEYRPKCSDTLWLGVKERWLNPFVDKRVDGR